MPDPNRDSLITQQQVDYYIAQIKAFIGQGLAETMPNFSELGASEDFIDGLALDAAVQVLQMAKQRKITFSNLGRSASFTSVTDQGGGLVRLHSTEVLGHVNNCGVLTSYLTASVSQITITGSTGYNGTYTVEAVGPYHIDVTATYTATSTGLLSFATSLRNPNVVQFGAGLLQENVDANTVRVSATQVNENVVITKDTNIFFFYDGSGSFVQELPALEAVHAGPLKTALLGYYDGSEVEYNNHVKFVQAGQGNPDVPNRDPSALTEAVFSWLRGVTSPIPVNPNTTSPDGNSTVTTALGRKCIIIAAGDESHTIYYNYGDPTTPITPATMPAHRGFGANWTQKARDDIAALKAYIDPCAGNFDYYRATILHFEAGTTHGSLPSVTLAHRNFLQSVQLGDLFEYTLPPSKLLTFRYNIQRRVSGGALWNMTTATDYYYGVIKSALKNMGIDLA